MLRADAERVVIYQNTTLAQQLTLHGPDANN
jgi:hypothetical protein